MISKELINSAMIDFTNDAKSVYGDHLEEVILFGSCARGDFDEESDMDIMILLDVPSEDIPNQRPKMNEAISNLDKKYDYELLFAPVVQSKDYFDRFLKASPFYQSIRREGIAYA